MLEDNDFDRVIDGALDAYGEADSGIERRILARVAAEHAPAPWRGRLLWAALLTASACLLIAIALMHGRPASAPQALRSAPAAPQQAPKETARLESPATQPASHLRRVARPAKNAGNPAPVALPKREIFPTPRPLSPAEQALADFAAHASEAERKSFVAAQEQMDQPIAIAAVHIDPIVIPPLKPPQPGAN